MPLSIDNVACGDGYTPALTLGPAERAEQVTYTVANASAVAQIVPASSATTLGSFANQPERIILPSQGAVFTRIQGMRFRNAIAGQVARVVAELTLPGDPLPTGGTPFAGTLSQTGAVTNPVGAGQLLADGFTFLDVPIVGATEATATEVVRTSAASDLTPGSVDITFSFAAWFNNNVARTITFVVCYSTDGGASWVPNGQIWRDTRVASPTDIGGVTQNFDFGGLSTLTLFSIRAYVTGAAGTIVRAGSYGLGGYMPAFITVRRQS